jgi:hypothetical protein
MPLPHDLIVARHGSKGELDTNKNAIILKVGQMGQCFEIPYFGDRCGSEARMSQRGE